MLHGGTSTKSYSHGLCEQGDPILSKGVVEVPEMTRHEDFISWYRSNVLLTTTELRFEPRIFRITSLNSNRSTTDA